MTDKKITQLTELTVPGATDELPIVDKLGTPETKRISWGNLTKGKLSNRITVGTTGNFAILKDAVDWFNASAASDTEILLDAGHHAIADTVTVNNGTYNLQIRGLGSTVSYLDTATGLTGKPMFNVKSNCDFNKVTCDGSTLASYGTLADENCFTFDTTAGIYSEIIDIIIDTFKIGVADLIGVDIFQFNFIISNCGTGTLIDYATEAIDHTSIDSEVGNYENCDIGVSLADALSCDFILVGLVFHQNNASQIGVLYDGTQFNYADVSNILNCTYNNVGTFLSGFDFTNARDADIVVLGNAGSEDKKPHAKINVVGNASTTTITTGGVYYKVVFTNTSSYTCKVTITDNKMLYQSSHQRDGIVFVSGNLSSNASPARSNTVCIRKSVNNITSVIGSGGVVTVTTSVPHHLKTGATIQTLGWSQANHNGLFNIISAPTTTTFTYGAGLTNATSTGGSIGDLLGQMVVRTQGAGVVVPFSFSAYCEELIEDDFLELYVTSPTSADVITVNGLTWLFNSQ